jgi:hypothetical protein
LSGSFDQTLKFWSYKSGELLNSVNTGLSIRSLAVINATNLTTSKFKLTPQTLKLDSLEENYF